MKNHLIYFYKWISRQLSLSQRVCLSSSHSCWLSIPANSRWDSSLALLLHGILKNLYLVKGKFLLSLTESPIVKLGLDRMLSNCVLNCAATPAACWCIHYWSQTRHGSWSTGCRYNERTMISKVLGWCVIWWPVLLTADRLFKRLLGNASAPSTESH